MTNRASIVMKNHISRRFRLLRVLTLEIYYTYISNSSKFLFFSRKHSFLSEKEKSQKKIKGSEFRL